MNTAANSPDPGLARGVLAADESGFRQIIERTPAGVCVTDENGIYEYVNPAYCRIYQYEPQELIGQHFTIVVPEDDRELLTRMHDQFIAGQTEIRGEWNVVTRAGKPLFILADAVRIVGNDGKPRKVTFVIDITARRRAEKQLEKREHDLRQANATKDRFFSIIAHDLKNPITALIMGSQMIVDRFEQLGAEKVRHYARLIYDSSRSSMNLLENLLQWARAQTGSIQHEPVLFDLAESVHETLRLVDQNAGAKRIALEPKVEQPLTVHADANMVRTVLRNLLTNAIKFTPEGGRVTVRARRENGSVRVAVQDTGVGIPPDDIDKLFRIDVSHTTPGTAREKGTGLGLILCKEFVELNGGRLWVESEAGKGSEFSFSLPTTPLQETDRG